MSTVERDGQRRRASVPGLVLLLAAAAGTFGVAWAVAFMTGVADKDLGRSLIGTVSAIVVGIPAALWIARRQQEQEAGFAQDAERTRRRAVLGLIRQELAEAREFLIARGKDRGQPYVFRPPLRTTTWTAMADGGELRHVDDPQLIDRLANAYHSIGTIVELERALFDFAMNPVPLGVTYSGTRDVFKELSNDLKQWDGPAVIDVGDAIAAIDSALG